jgi:predicted phosphodiesterase
MPFFSGVVVLAKQVERFGQPCRGSPENRAYRFPGRRAWKYGGTVRPSLALIVASAVGTSVYAFIAAAPTADAAPTIAAAGDIACPRPCAPQRETARLTRRLHPDAVLALGDNQYNHGSLRTYRRSYAPTWGAFRSITYPVPGNHDYETRRARGYFRYFGRRAHRGTGGHYSFDIGAWHLVALNSEVRSRGETRWLRRDLHRDHHRCELAYWHEPRWSSGIEHGGTTAVAPWWRILYRQGVDVVLNGHEHNYERFAPMSPAGRKTSRGIREFVVGTGGYYLYSLGRAVHGSQRRHVTHGVLQMELRSSSYSWRFVKTRGGTGDRGNTACHT